MARQSGVWRRKLAQSSVTEQHSCLESVRNWVRPKAAGCGVKSPDWRQEGGRRRPGIGKAEEARGFANLRTRRTKLRGSVGQRARGRVHQQQRVAKQRQAGRGGQLLVLAVLRTLDRCRSWTDGMEMLRGE